MQQNPAPNLSIQPANQNVQFLKPASTLVVPLPPAEMRPDTPLQDPTNHDEVTLSSHIPTNYNNDIDDDMQYYNDDLDDDALIEMEMQVSQAILEHNQPQQQHLIPETRNETLRIDSYSNRPFIATQQQQQSNQNLDHLFQTKLELEQEKKEREKIQLQLMERNGEVSFARTKIQQLSQFNAELAQKLAHQSQLQEQHTQQERRNTDAELTRLQNELRFKDQEIRSLSVSRAANRPATTPALVHFPKTSDLKFSSSSSSKIKKSYKPIPSFPEPSLQHPRHSPPATHEIGVNTTQDTLHTTNTCLELSIIPTTSSVPSLLSLLSNPSLFNLQDYTKPIQNWHYLNVIYTITSGPLYLDVKDDGVVGGIIQNLSLLISTTPHEKSDDSIGVVVHEGDSNTNTSVITKGTDRYISKLVFYISSIDSHGWIEGILQSQDLVLYLHSTLFTLIDSVFVKGQVKSFNGGGDEMECIVELLTIFNRLVSAIVHNQSHDASSTMLRYFTLFLIDTFN